MKKNKQNHCITQNLVAITQTSIPFTMTKGCPGGATVAMCSWMVRQQSVRNCFLNSTPPMKWSLLTQMVWVWIMKSFALVWVRLAALSRCLLNFRAIRSLKNIQSRDFMRSCKKTFLRSMNRCPDQTELKEDGCLLGVFSCCNGVTLCW